MKWYVQIGVLSLSFLALAAAIPDDQEFVGPFPSWRDLKRDYGAVGDGQKDDTDALQRALLELTKHTNACVLYVPSGAYRLTRPVRTQRKEHTDAQGVALVGEDPRTTALVWDGPTGAPMLAWDAWYSKISRLTLDGRGRAGAALFYGPAFSTFNETSDMVFRDAMAGVHFGENSTQGQAENAVWRCQFLRCSLAGILTENWNSMDIWVWYSRFEDCRFGMLNQMGNFHAWQNLFLRSRESDIATRNLMVFSFVGNTSLGSARFLDFDTGHTWGAPNTIAGNRILDPTGDLPLKLGNAGPYLVMDNVFRMPPGTTNRAVQMTWADQTFVGNTYSQTNAVIERGRFRRVAETTRQPAAIDAQLPVLPSSPPRRARQVFEVAAGADAEAIQATIDQAAALAGHRPVVHLPMGRYNVARTLVVPANCDLQLVGDSGAETGTRLNWAGPEGGVLLRLVGPSRAILRDFLVHAPRGRGIVVENADQAGGRIFADQLNVNGPTAGPTVAAVRVSALSRTDVELCCLQGNGNAGHWVEVIGGEAAPNNQICVFNGATGTAAGQYQVRNGGQLVVRGVYHEKSADSLRGIHLTGRGRLAIDATRFSYKTSATAPLVAVDDFSGLFTLATAILMPVDSTNVCRFDLAGNGRAAQIMALNDQFLVYEPGVDASKVWNDHTEPPAQAAMAGCNVNVLNDQLREPGPTGYPALDQRADASDPARSSTNVRALANVGELSDEVLLRQLAPLREARVWLPAATTPAGVTDLRIYRVMVSGGTEAAVEFRAQ